MSQRVKAIRRGRVMNTSDALNPSTAPVARGLLKVGARVGIRLLRWALYGLLSLLRPILIPVLTGVSVGGVLLWAIFVLAARDSQFPTLHVLGASLACAVAAVLYHALLELLIPGSQRSR